MRKTKIEEMDLLAETDQLVMEQKGKKMDRTTQYHNYYRCSRPRR